MPVFHTTRRVRHSPERMFALVADVERYPEFLPLCEGLTIRSRATDAQGREVLTAEMRVGYKAIHERFTSRVTLDPAGMQVWSNMSTDRFAIWKTAGPSRPRARAAMSVSTFPTNFAASCSAC